MSLSKPLHVYCALIVEEEGNLWHRQFGSTLRRMGHQVSVPPVIGLRDSWLLWQAGIWARRDREKLTDKLLRDIKKRHAERAIDVVLVYLYPFQFSTDLFV